MVSSDVTVATPASLHTSLRSMRQASAVCASSEVPLALFQQRRAGIPGVSVSSSVAGKPILLGSSPLPSGVAIGLTRAVSR